MRELLAGLVPGLPDAAVRAIVARADGIPLYAVETVRMLLAEGGSRSRTGVYRPVGDLDDLAVPETLTALIASRLDGLDPTTGRSCPTPPSSARASRSPGCGRLGPRRGRARAPPSGARPPRAAHARGRPAEPRSAASTPSSRRSSARSPTTRWPGRDRKSRHLAAARYFEALGSDELAGALAGHYLAAHANAPAGPEGDALAAQARIALRAAADRAAALGRTPRRSRSTSRH